MDGVLALWRTDCEVRPHTAQGGGSSKVKFLGQSSQTVRQIKNRNRYEAPRGSY